MNLIERRNDAAESSTATPMNNQQRASEEIMKKIRMGLLLLFLVIAIFASSCTKMCHHCHGTGSTGFFSKCSVCHGTGSVVDDRAIRAISVWGGIFFTRWIIDFIKWIQSLFSARSLTKALQDAPADERCKILKKLGELGTKAKVAIPEIIKNFENQNPNVRIEAAQALVKIGVADTFPRLIQMLEDQNPAVRTNAAQLLASIGPKAKFALPILIQKLQDQDHTVRKAVLNALVQMNRSLLWSLIQGLIYPDATVREAAAQALKKIVLFLTPKEPKNPAVQKTTKIDPNWTKLAMAVFYLRPPQAKIARPPLVKALRDQNWRVREAAVLALEIIDPKAKFFLTYLMKACKDPELAVRIAAARIIKKSR